MKVIEVKLLVEDTMNPCDDEAKQFVIEMISEVFGKEERKEYPRLKLMLIQVVHIR